MPISTGNQAAPARRPRRTDKATHWWERPEYAPHETPDRDTEALVNITLGNDPYRQMEDVGPFVSVEDDNRPVISKGAQAQRLFAAGATPGEVLRQLRGQTGDIDLAPMVRAALAKKLGAK